MCDRNPIQCIIPPYITEQLVNSENEQIRSRAIAHLSTAATLRAFREAAQVQPTLMATMSPNQQKHRLVYDARNTNQLPGNLVRSEGDPNTPDVSVNEAYNFSGDAYDFYDQLFQRNSLDDNGSSPVFS